MPLNTGKMKSKMIPFDTSAITTVVKISFENERKDVTWNDELEQFANFRTKQIYLF